MHTEDEEDVLSLAAGEAAAASGPEAKDENIRVVAKLAKEQLELEARIQKGEAFLAGLKERHREISEKELPNAMIEMGSRGFTLADGSKIAIDTTYAANIKVENRAEAYGWFEKNGHAPLIKSDVVVIFGKGNLKHARALQKRLAKTAGRKVELDMSIHWSTLRAWAKEQIEAEKLEKDQTGKEVQLFPRDLINVHVIDKAKITPKE